MKTLCLILGAIVALCASFSFADDVTVEARFRAKRIQKELERGGLKDLAYKIDDSLDHLLRVAAKKLEVEGYEKDAEWLLSEWEGSFKGSVRRMAQSGRPIGDHEPLNAYLALAMQLLYAKLGFETCKTLHLTDLDVFNFSLKIAFRPCTFPMDGVPYSRLEEYEFHMAHDPKYGQALIPRTSFWLTQLGCSIGTYGTGIFFVCGPLSTAVAWAVDKWVALPITDKIYEWAECK